jgi:hypothetical protein
MLSRTLMNFPGLVYLLCSRHHRGDGEECSHGMTVGAQLVKALLEGGTHEWEAQGPVSPLTADQRRTLHLALVSMLAMVKIDPHFTFVLVWHLEGEETVRMDHSLDISRERAEVIAQRAVHLYSGRGGVIYGHCFD